MESEVQWVLWTGTLGFETPIPDRIRAAVAGGYSRITISPSDVARERAEAGHARGIRALASRAGVEVMMDPVVNWYPASDAGPLRSAAFSLDDMLDMCQETGSVAMTAVGLIDSLVPESALPQHFAELCDRSADIGVDVALEFIPMTAIADLRLAWDIVRQADRPNGGLLFDTWHYFRGSPDLTLLEQVRGDRVFAVQVNDASAPTGDMWHDTLHREIPGNGTFELAPLLDGLARIGGLSRVGAEVMHPDLAALDPVEAADLANRPVRALLDDAMRHRPA